MFISDKTWNEWWFLEYSNKAKLLYMYICSTSNIYGINSYPLKKLCFDTDLTKDEVRSALKELESQIVIAYEGKGLLWSYIRGFFEVSSGNLYDEFSDPQKKLKNPRQLAGFKNFYFKQKFPNDLKSILEIDFQRVLSTTHKPQTIPLSRKEVVTIRDNFECVYCKKEFSKSDDIEIDHLHPRADGGSNSWENLVASCKTCNREKSDLSINDKEKYKPDPNYRKFEAIKALKKPEIFTRYRRIFNQDISEEILNEKPATNINTNTPRKEKQVPIYTIICKILENSKQPLNINQIQKIIKDENLFTTRKGEIPDTGRLSAYISRQNKKYNEIQVTREGRAYLYSLK